MSYRDITHRSVLDALEEFGRIGETDFLAKYGFGPARAYYLSHQGRLYPSKAIVGAAHGYAFPDEGPLGSDDFVGGDATVKPTLEGLGFTVVVRREDSAKGYQEVFDLEDVVSERLRRDEMWNALLRSGGPSRVEPSLLRDLHIYGGAQGIWVDKEKTQGLGPSGATVGLLHTGSSYADDLTDEGVLYHYPKTQRPGGRDMSEVDATKTACALQLPVFVVSYPSPKSVLRDVHRGWVADWDDESGEFLVLFGEQPPSEPAGASDEEPPFSLTTSGHRKMRGGELSARDPKFQFEVFKRYGPKCAVCDIAVKEVLQAAHIRGKKDKGSDDPRNGLVLCATHHAAFDAHLFSVEPGTLRICFHDRGPSAADLRISAADLRELPRTPHPSAVEWRWKSSGFG